MPCLAPQQLKPAGITAEEEWEAVSSSCSHRDPSCQLGRRMFTETMAEEDEEGV